MKKIVILLFITGISFAQNHHFKAERKEVTWQMAFKTKQTDISMLFETKHIEHPVGTNHFLGNPSL
jgi:hypothetical protein